MKKILFLILFLTGLFPVFDNNGLYLGGYQSYGQEDSYGNEVVICNDPDRVTTDEYTDYYIVETCISVNEDGDPTKNCVWECSTEFQDKPDPDPDPDSCDPSNPNYDPIACNESNCNTTCPVGFEMDQYCNCNEVQQQCYNTCQEGYYQTLDCGCEPIQPPCPTSCPSGYELVNCNCVPKPKDCAGVEGGTAYIASCGCIGGTTGKTECLPSDLPCNTFAERINDILVHEGGFVNNPNDLGKATNKGISWTVWQNNAQSILGVEPSLSNLQNLTNTQASLIYKELYWDKVKANQIVDGDIRYLLFDFFVNAGGNATKVLQKTLNQLGNNLTVDGSMGPLTLNAINSANVVQLYNNFKANRQAYYENLAAKSSKLATFLSGWTNRVNKFNNKTNTDKYNVNCD